ncbi:MAG: AbrB/MazE/SpoVT family DNA-binding domain-containing protein [Thermoprotei archaeon]|nr:MAG: AbrB/MazE/SpoVT family DNA-binding domain-containing protein [Thermoprotei archaeon]
MSRGQALRRRGAPGFNIRSLPYEVKIYLNNQVLVPASLVRALGLREARRARVTLEYEGTEFSIDVKLLRTRYTDSRQFTIPREARERYGLKPGLTVKVKKIEPLP